MRGRVSSRGALWHGSAFGWANGIVVVQPTFYFLLSGGLDFKQDDKDPFLRLAFRASV